MKREERRKLADALRFLSIDAIERAKSGHPGMPMGMADIAEVLWNDFLRFDPSEPNWFNRDRFVLSNGHGSMLLYALLYLSGFDLSLEEIKNFRQLHSKTPGHPEYGVTPGVEVTTGPLGQGLAVAVGMALAEKLLAERYNRPGFPVVDHYTYVFAGDGCLMEGVSAEACSLAGTWKLGKLIVFYDDNGISIDGKVSGWFTEDVAGRFRAYGWQVIGPVDGHDPDSIGEAIQEARGDLSSPSLIICRTKIGFGSPHLAGTARVHGSPLGAGEVEATRKNLGWKYPPFTIPKEIRQAWDARERGLNYRRQWEELFSKYSEEYPELAEELSRRIRGELPSDWNAPLIELMAESLSSIVGSALATRKASGRCLEKLGPKIPELIGGSADLSGSNNTRWSGSKPVGSEWAEANYIHYGVREFAMAAIANGLYLSGAFRPYVGTFLVFSDYARPAVRLSALMKLPVIYVFTHDSIGLGEDGPTHQPVEHLEALRLIPGLEVWRPADLFETAVAWYAALERRDGPVCLALSRQEIPPVTRGFSPDLKAILKAGAYPVWEGGRELQITLMASGSELPLAAKAGLELAQLGYGVRVVSVLCRERMAELSGGELEALLGGKEVAKVAVEAGRSGQWWRFVLPKGTVISIERFGESAPGEVLFEEFGFTTDRIVEEAEKLLK